MNQDYLGNLKESYVLGKEGNIIELVFIENILAKYIGYADGCNYVKGLRYPIANKGLIAKYKKQGMLSKQPIYPIYSVELFKSIIELLVIDNSNHIDDFFTNKLIGNTDSIYSDISRHCDIEKLVLDMVPTITKVDYNSIIKYFAKLISMAHDIIDNVIDNILVIDIESSYIEINVYSNILEYRYREACTHKEYNCIPMCDNTNYDIIEDRLWMMEQNYQVCITLLMDI